MSPSSGSMASRPTNSRDSLRVAIPFSKRATASATLADRSSERASTQAKSHPQQWRRGWDSKSARACDSRPSAMQASRAFTRPQATRTASEKLA